MGRAVITIQAGSFANYVGAHYWNFQVFTSPIWRVLTVHNPLMPCLCYQEEHSYSSFHSEIDLSHLSQDEVLGLANDPQEGYMAEQIDPTAVLRQNEDRQARTSFSFNIQTRLPLMLHRCMRYWAAASLDHQVVCNSIKSSSSLPLVF